MSRSRQYTRKELETLRRADLQTLYKIHGLRGANQRTDALITELDTFYRTSFVPPASPSGRRPGTAAGVRQLKPIADQAAVPASTGNAKAAGVGGVKRRPLPTPLTSTGGGAAAGVRPVKSADGLSEGSRVQTLIGTASSSATSTLHEKLTALSDRVAALDARLSEPSSSGLPSEVARLRSEVERLEGELRAVQEGDAQAGPDSEEAAERNAAALASALQERDEAWTMRMREAEVEWKAQLGVVEARWQGRFARMEELIRAHTSQDNTRSVSSSSALGKRPQPASPATFASNAPHLPDISASKRARTTSGPSMTDHSAIRDQIRAASRRSLSPTKSPRTPSPGKADRGDGNVFKTPELPASAIRGGLKKIPEIGLGMARGPPALFGLAAGSSGAAGPVVNGDVPAFTGAHGSSTDPIEPGASAVSMPSGMSTPPNPTSALGVEPRTPSPTPARRALLPDNSHTPSAFRSDYFAGLPALPHRHAERDHLPFPLFATTPKPATSAPKSPTLDAPPSASSKRRQAAVDAEEAQAAGHIMGTPRTPHANANARTPARGLGYGLGVGLTTPMQGRRVSEKIAQAHVGLMGITESGSSSTLGQTLVHDEGRMGHARTASGSGSGLGGALGAQRRARSVSSQRSVRSVSKQSHSVSEDDEAFPDAIQEEDEDADYGEVSSEKEDEGDDLDAENDTPRPANPAGAGTSITSTGTGMKRVISTDYAFPPHLRLGDFDAEGAAGGAPRLSPSPSITENRFSSLPFPRPGAPGTGGLASGHGHGHGHAKHRSISATTTASNASYTSDHSAHSMHSVASAHSALTEISERSERSRSRSVRSSSPSRDFMDIALHGFADESPSAQAPHTPAHRTLLGTERYNDTKYGDVPLVSWGTPGEGMLDFGETPRRG